jgi:hypothetical protein
MPPLTPAMVSVYVLRTWASASSVAGRRQPSHLPHAQSSRILTRARPRIYQCSAAVARLVRAEGGPSAASQEGRLPYAREGGRCGEARISTAGPWFG